MSVAPAPSTDAPYWTWKRITALVVTAFVVLLALYDVIEYAFTPGGDPGTISAVIFGAETRHPLLICELCFGLGVFVGHTALYQTSVTIPPAEQTVLAVVKIPAKVAAAPPASDNFHSGTLSRAEAQAAISPTADFGPAPPCHPVPPIAPFRHA